LASVGGLEQVAETFTPHDPQSRDRLKFTVRLALSGK
jgi:hypothetical protein